MLRLLTAGSVPASCPDWLHGALNWPPSLDLSKATRDRALDAAAALDSSITHGSAGVEAAWERLLGDAKAVGSVLNVAQVASLESAQHIARDLHLLRRYPPRAQPHAAVYVLPAS